MQETFIELITETRAGRPPEQVRAWLYRVAANGAISRGRHGSVWNRLVPRLLDRREPASPESEALRVERDSELHTALATLPSDAGAALLLQYLSRDGVEWTPVDAGAEGSLAIADGPAGVIGVGGDGPASTVWALVDSRP